jgi:hypothetical protein
MKTTVVIFAVLSTVLAQTDTVVATSTCVAHEDHWDCPSGVAEPTTPPPSSTATAADLQSTSDSFSLSVTAATTCEPHGDHWHCPSGVSEPTTAPAASATEEDTVEATATTCEPHGDHWHCPSGVAEPTTEPAEATTTSGGAGQASASSSSPTAFTGAAVVGAKNGGIVAAALGAVGMLMV